VDIAKYQVQISYNSWREAKCLRQGGVTSNRPCDGKQTVQCTVLVPWCNENMRPVTLKWLNELMRHKSLSRSKCKRFANVTDYGSMFISTVFNAPYSSPHAAISNCGRVGAGILSFLICNSGREISGGLRRPGEEGIMRWTEWTNKEVLPENSEWILSLNSVLSTSSLL
jgi:hypothetical protein